MKSVMEKSGVHPTSGLRPRRKSQLKGFVRERSTAASCCGPLQKIEAPAPRLGQPNNNVLRRGRCRSLWVNFVESMRRRFPYPRNDPLTTAAPILLVIGGDCTQYPPRDDWVRCWPRDRPRNTAGEIPSIHSQAPCVFDGPINGECFRAYVEQQLVPLLKPGDIVIMDNLGSHKLAALRALIRAAGARLWYLPPYSPDLNPIEQAFAKIKHWMRSAQKRTIEDAWRHIGSLVETIDPTECNNYFANAGYASVKK